MNVIKKNIEADKCDAVDSEYRDKAAGRIAELHKDVLTLCSVVLGHKLTTHLRFLLNIR